MDRDKQQKLLSILHLSLSNFQVCCIRDLALMLFEVTSEGGIHKNNVSKANLMTSRTSFFKDLTPFTHDKNTLQSAGCSTGEPLPATNVSGFSD